MHGATPPNINEARSESAFRSQATAARISPSGGSDKSRSSGHTRGRSGRDGFKTEQTRNGKRDNKFSLNIGDTTSSVKAVDSTIVNTIKARNEGRNCKSGCRGQPGTQQGNWREAQENHAWVHAAQAWGQPAQCSGYSDCHFAAGVGTARL